MATFASSVGQPQRKKRRGEHLRHNDCIENKLGDHRNILELKDGWSVCGDLCFGNEGFEKIRYRKTKIIHDFLEPESPQRSNL